MNQAPSPSKWLYLGWLLVRVPLFAFLALLLREPLITFTERLFDIGGITVLAIGILGTPLSRLGVFLGAAAFLAILDRIFSRYSTFRRYAALVAISVMALMGFIVVRAVTKREALLLAVLVATNFFPLNELTKSRSQLARLWDGFATVAVGITEVFFLRAFATWLVERFLPQLRGILALQWFFSALSALTPAATLAVLAFQNGELFSAEQSLRLDARALKFADGDYNWIELDSTNRYLFATGHGAEHLERFDTADLSRDPLRAKVSTGHAQGFAYDAGAELLYVIDTEKLTILVLRSPDLELIRSFPIPNLSPGDPWLALEPRTNTMTVLSEADIKSGVPFQVLDGTTGALLYGAEEDPGNVLVDPTRPLLYLGYFRHGVGVRIYDLAAHSFGTHFNTSSRPDRLAYVRGKDEVLVALPTESRVLRLRGGSLEAIGEFKTVFGVRTFAIDETRKLLFCGSLATGMLAVLDLETGRELSRAYVSPWLRTIQADTHRHILYLSANGGLYSFNYGDVKRSPADP